VFVSIKVGEKIRKMKMGRLKILFNLIAKSLCLEYPVRDEEGNIIRYEYYTLRGGRISVVSKPDEEIANPEQGEAYYQKQL
jgi:hypothetical protein